jgi:lysozyme
MRLPPSKPKASRQTVEVAALRAWKAEGLEAKDFPATYVFACRAYYEDTMGKPGENDVDIYDDALFIVTPTHFSSWNANTDPSRYGWNPGVGKFMARLKPGVWWMRRLKHKMRSPNGYMAFGQGGDPVTVERIRKNGTIAITESGGFGINLHRGGNSGTSSEGCQTIPPAQWPRFDNTLAKFIGADRFRYILAEGAIT